MPREEPPLDGSQLADFRTLLNSASSRRQKRGSRRNATGTKSGSEVVVHHPLHHFQIDLSFLAIHIWFVRIRPNVGSRQTLNETDFDTSHHCFTRFRSRRNPGSVGLSRRGSCHVSSDSPTTPPFVLDTPMHFLNKCAFSVRF